MSAEPDRHGKPFPRAARLTRPQEYQRVFAGAKRLGDRYFTVLATPNDQVKPRLGLAVSKRSAPRAVDRNRIKRIVRETFRHYRDGMTACDLVVIAKSGAREAPKDELARALARHWKRLSKS